MTSDSASYEHAQSAGSDIVTVQHDQLSSVWIAPAGAPSSAQRITPPAGHIRQAVWSPDGTMVASIRAARQENLWRLGRDGATQQLTQGKFADVNPSVSATAGTISFTTNRAEDWTIWTMDANGNGLRQITNGTGIRWLTSSVASDGSILFGTQERGLNRIRRARYQGEVPSVAMQIQAIAPVVSPDGKVMACMVMDEASGMRWEVATVDLTTARIVDRYPNVPINLNTGVRWSPDGTALTYLRDEDGVSNIWRMSIASGVEEPLTHFKEDKIFSFDWSHDARDLAMVRGIAASDVLLIRHTR